jgi:hypothetical protein
MDADITFWEGHRLVLVKFQSLNSSDTPHTYTRPMLDLVLEWHDLIALLDLDLDLGLDLDLDFPESGSRLSGTIFILPLQGT